MENLRGYHLMVEGFRGSEESLGSKETVFAFLQAMPEHIGMIRIGGPYVVVYKPLPTNGAHHDWGITGVVFIATSHIAIHTWPEREFATIDLYSCKPFDAVEAIKMIKRAFGFAYLSSQSVERPWVEEAEHQDE